MTELDLRVCPWCQEHDPDCSYCGGGGLVITRSCKCGAPAVTVAEAADGQETFLCWRCEFGVAGTTLT